MISKQEKDFLRKYDASKYDRPSVTTDILIFTIQNQQFKILLIKRKNFPYKGKWAIPGGFVNMDEGLDECALRELGEETGVRNAQLLQWRCFGKPDRDPRTRVITVAYISLIPFNQLRFSASTDAKDVKLFPVYNLPKLAFDHNKIINSALTFLKKQTFISGILKPLLPKTFALDELCTICQTVLNKKISLEKLCNSLLCLRILKQVDINKKGNNKHYTFRS